MTRRTHATAALAASFSAVLIFQEATIGVDAHTPLRLTFDSDPVETEIFTSLSNSGSGELAVDVASLYGGVVMRSLERETPGADFPDYDGSSTAPRAVIRVSNSGTADDMNPLAAPFSFGADFRLDEISTGGSTIDSGDILIQRGLGGDPVQYKIEVEDARAQCLIKGDLGRKKVVSPVEIVPLQWYRVECSRDGDRVEIALTTYGADGSSTTSTRTVSGVIGELGFAPSVPLGIGGKLRPNGTLVAGSTDQFNGHVDEVFLTLGSAPSGDGTSVTIAAAGDLCGGCGRTSQRVAEVDPDVVVTMGDLAYDEGLLAEFHEKYGGGTDPARRWGRPSIKDITLPGYGNHDCYDVPRDTGATKQGCDDAVTYFGPDTDFGTDIPGTPGSYHTVVGDWLVVHLNSAGQEGTGQATATEVADQRTALEQVLLGDAHTCELVIWHHPRYSSGGHGNNQFIDSWYETAYSYGVDVILNGHDHDYERFAPQDGDGNAVPDGIRQFVVGTGGVKPRAFKTVQPHSLVRIVDKGILTMALGSDATYSWAFLDDETAAVDDAGSGTCRP